MTHHTHRHPQPSWAHLKAQPIFHHPIPWNCHTGGSFQLQGRKAGLGPSAHGERGNPCPEPSPELAVSPGCSPMSWGAEWALNWWPKITKGVQWQWGVLGWSENVEGACCRVPCARASSQGPGAGNCRVQAALHRTLPRSQWWGLMRCS